MNEKNLNPRGGQRRDEKKEIKTPREFKRKYNIRILFSTGEYFVLALLKLISARGTKIKNH